jgi:hypothetical protein
MEGFNFTFHRSLFGGCTNGLLMRQRLAAGLFEKPSHVLAQRLHRLNTFRIVSYFSGVSTDAQIPVTGTRDNHLVDQKEIVHRTEDMGGARATDGDDGCSYFSFEQVSVGAGYDRAPFDEGLHIGRHVRDISRRAEKDSVGLLHLGDIFVDPIFRRRTSLIFVFRAFVTG